MFVEEMPKVKIKLYNVFKESNEDLKMGRRADKENLRAKKVLSV